MIETEISKLRFIQIEMFTFEQKKTLLCSLQFQTKTFSFFNPF